MQSKETLPETKKRREFLSPFFSKAAISRVEPYLHRQKLSGFLSTLEKANGTVVDFYLAFRCLTADLVMDYCFQQDLDALAAPGFQDKTVEAFIQGFDMALVGTFFPNFFGFVNKIIMALPEGVRERYFAPVHGFQMMQKVRSVLLPFPSAFSSVCPSWLTWVT